MASLPLSRPVGDVPGKAPPDANMFDDILIVQYLLNRSPGPGKPSPPLKQDGALTPQLIAAIRDYESTRGAVDGRIDPGDPILASLNTIPLTEFEGITDFLERRSVIVRIHPQWNFTRGDFKSLTSLAGLSLRFNSSSTWLPQAIKNRFIPLFNMLLDPARDPSSTWGVHPFDWFHSHLGAWSGVANKPVSAAAENWTNAASGIMSQLRNKPKPFLDHGELTVEKIPLYRPVYDAFVHSPDVALMLNTFATLPEGFIVHHTFEGISWRPDEMKSGDVRRHWMVDINGNIKTPPYRTSKELNAAQDRKEFYCEGTISVNFLIDKAGVIHPVLGTTPELSLVTELRSDELVPPVSYLDDVVEM